MNLIVKVAAVIFYLLVPASHHVSALAEYQQLFSAVFLVLMVAHLGEYIWVRKRLLALNTGENHLFLTMLFGFAHWLPLLKSEQQ